MVECDLINAQSRGLYRLIDKPNPGITPKFGRLTLNNLIGDVYVYMIGTLCALMSLLIEITIKWINHVLQ